MKSLEVTPTIVALRNRAETVKKLELERIQSRLSGLAPQDRAMVESLANAIANKLVHGAMVTLKTEATSSSGSLFVEAARRFFGLESTSTSAEARPDGNADAATCVPEEDVAPEEAPPAPTPLPADQPAARWPRREPRA